VHLSGIAKRCGNPPTGMLIFTLPPGYRPKGDYEVHLAVLNGLTAAPLSIYHDGGIRSAAADGEFLWLNGVSFRCGPSGKNGCP
jgi:hypothetical protein